MRQDAKQDSGTWSPKTHMTLDARTATARDIVTQCVRLLKKLASEEETVQWRKGILNGGVWVSVMTGTPRDFVTEADIPEALENAGDATPEAAICRIYPDMLNEGLCPS